MNPESASGHFSRSPVSELSGISWFGRARLGWGHHLRTGSAINAEFDACLCGLSVSPLTIKPWGDFHLRDSLVLTTGGDPAWEAVCKEAEESLALDLDCKDSIVSAHSPNTPKFLDPQTPHPLWHPIFSVVL